MIGKSRNRLLIMEEIRPLAETSFDDIFMAWEDSFRDYERTRTKEELRKMLSRRGFAPALSFGAFDEQQLVSFTLNAFGTHNGVNTAYDTGTGTIKSHRGKELSTKIFMESLPYLKQAGTRQYLLEVLQHNKAAVSIYTNIGFRVSREFNYFISNMENSSLKGSAMQARYRLIDIDLNSKVEMMCMWDFAPSWQNSFESIARNIDGFKIIGAMDDDILAGYGIIELATGDIPQLAVDSAYRRQGVGSAILKELLKYNQNSAIQVIILHKG